MTRTVTEEFPPVPLDELAASIRDFPLLEVRDKQALIRRLVNRHPILCLQWGSGWRYRRARKLRVAAPPRTVEDLIWRKDGRATLGRANPAGFSVLYLADRPNTSFCEIRAIDDEVLLAEFEILSSRSIRVAPIGELECIQKSGRGYLTGDSSSCVTELLNACNHNDAMALLVTDSFLRECLLNGDDNYEISSSVAISIFDKLPSVSAIAYPSMRAFGAINFAVRADRFWDSWGISAVRCGRAIHVGQGYYQLKNTRDVVGITTDGQLEWSADMGTENSLCLLRPLWTPK